MNEIRRIVVAGGTGQLGQLLARRWAAAGHEVRWHWVRGHDGHDMNERADQLARNAIRLG